MGDRGMPTWSREPCASREPRDRELSCREPGDDERRQREAAGGSDDRRTKGAFALTRGIHYRTPPSPPSPRSTVLPVESARPGRATSGTLVAPCSPQPGGSGLRVAEGLTSSNLDRTSHGRNERTKLDTFGLNCQMIYEVTDVRSLIAFWTQMPKMATATLTAMNAATTKADTRVNITLYEPPSSGY